jgi:hypothetical protein
MRRGQTVMLRIWGDFKELAEARHRSVECSVPLADARETNDGAVAREWAIRGYGTCLGRCGCRSLCDGVPRSSGSPELRRSFLQEGIDGFPVVLGLVRKCLECRRQLQHICQTLLLALP